MRVRSAVRRMCRDCYVVKKKGVVYIRCKTVKKHKQRQGFHTEAGVLAWEGEGQESGAYACCVNQTRPNAIAGAWRAAAPAMAGSSGDLASLPWLPAWASVPAAAGRKDIQQGAPSKSPAGSAIQSAWLIGGDLASPLRALGGWMRTLILGRLRSSGP